MNSQHRWPGESRFHVWLYLLPGLLIDAVFIRYPVLETILTFFLCLGYLAEELGDIAPLGALQR